MKRRLPRSTHLCLPTQKRHVPHVCPFLATQTAQAQRRASHSQQPLHQHQQYVPQQPRYPRDQPRWKQTPPLMTAPYRSKPPVQNNDFQVNEDPARLDDVYANVLGNGHQDLLTEEARWLAVTHKSFDHGRRGFNDRLSLIGGWPYRRVVISLANGTFRENGLRNASFHGPREWNDWHKTYAANRPVPQGCLRAPSVEWIECLDRGE